MGRKFLLMVLAAASLMLVSAGLASGATQTFMDMKPIDGIPIEAPNVGFPLSVPQFDPALGVLQERNQQHQDRQSPPPPPYVHHKRPGG